MHERRIVVLFDDLRVFDFVVELYDLAFVGGLLVAGRVVFRVLGKVAVASRFRDAFDNLLAFGGLQIFKSFHRLVISLLCHKKLVSHKKTSVLWCLLSVPDSLVFRKNTCKKAFSSGTLKIQP